MSAEDTEGTTPQDAGPAPAGPAPGAKPATSGKADPEQPGVVIRDKRRVDASGKLRNAAASAATPAAPTSEPTPDAPASGDAGDASAEATPVTENGAPERGAPEAVEPVVGTAEVETPDPTETADVVETAETPEIVEPTEVIDPADYLDATSEQPAPAARPAPEVFSAEVGVLRSALDERTRDLQRLSAEYANYRKRVERDRGLAGQQATAAVLAALIPVLDDLDRAREHGDLVGPFVSVAESLNAALAKFGLTAFGEKGDPFDPTRHEAVAHLTSAEVTEPSCVDIMRRGYLLGDRLLRPAMVAVADPAE